MVGSEPVIFAVALLVQLIGVLSVTLARISERSAAQLRCQADPPAVSPGWA